MPNPLALDAYFPTEIVFRRYTGHLLLVVEAVARGSSAVVRRHEVLQHAIAHASRPGHLIRQARSRR